MPDITSVYVWSYHVNGYSGESRYYVYTKSSSIVEAARTAVVAVREDSSFASHRWVDSLEFVGFASSVDFTTLIEGGT